MVTHCTSLLHYIYIACFVDILLYSVKNLVYLHVITSLLNALIHMRYKCCITLQSVLWKNGGFILRFLVLAPLSLLS